MKDKSLEFALKSVEIEAAEVARVAEIVRTAEFGQAVDILSKANKIVTSGSGGTGVAAKKFAHSLSCIERNGVFLSPAEGMHGGMGVVQEGDAMVVVSKGGKTA
ncbi:MAG: SIS domain-containing protein, partial [Christensenella hongkongensis]|uniref:SIS domain-containing protein n=1 Tax=Christensenella hongkongensis TaxID=270498 RepID=UPI002A765D2D